MNNRILLKYHSWSGLLAGIFIVIMGISGAILIFQHDIEDALWKEYTQVETHEPLEIDKGFEAIQKQYKDWSIRLIHFEEGEVLIFNLRRPTERLFVFVHPTTGEIIQELNELTTFSRWLLKFHYSFQAGVFGRMLVFIAGVLFLLSILTGLILYRKSLLKVLFFREKINFRNKRSLNSSLHRIIGVWSLLLNLLLVITGVFLSYEVVMASLAAPVMPNSPLVTTPIENILQEIKEENPDFTPTYISLPASKDGAVSIFGLYNDDPFYFSEFYNSFSADYKSGEITGSVRVQDADMGTKLKSTLIPLHFGNFGGIWTKLLYCIVGLSGPLLSITGFVIWQKGNQSKRRKKRTKK